MLHFEDLVSQSEMSIESNTEKTWYSKDKFYAFVKDTAWFRAAAVIFIIIIIIIIIIILSRLCRVFTVVYLKQTMILGYILVVLKLFSTYIFWCMYSKTCLKRNAIVPVFFFRFHRFPFYKGLCFNKTKYKKYDRLGLQWRNNLK